MEQEFEKNQPFDLRLSVVAYCNQPPDEAMLCLFHERGGSIGRGDSNDFVLADTESVVSRTHALISYQNGEYLLIDQSTNGTFVNDSPDRLEPGEAYPIQDGDRLLVGNYLLVASLVPVDSPLETISPLLREKTQSPFHPMLEPGETTDGDEQQEVLPAMEDWPSDAQRPNWFPVGEEDVSEVSDTAVPEERPPVPVMQQHLAQSVSENGRADEPDKDPAGQGQARRRISGTGVPTGYIPGALQFEELAEGQMLSDGSMLEDPFAPIDIPQSPVTEPPTPVESDKLPRDFVNEPEPIPVTTPSAAVSKAGLSDPKPGQAERDLLEALVQGLGSSSFQVSPEGSSEFMNQIGQLVHEAVQGLIDTLRLRDEFKREFYVPVTRIAPTDNNLFKHSANVDDALSRAFSGVGAAYLGPVESTRQAFQDIAAHQLALVAGMQAAIGAVLERFSPQSLEQRIGKTTMLDGVVPQIRKAHMWEQFEKEYTQIAEQAEEDFQRVFGQHFERAYTQEIHRLHSAGFGGNRGNHES